VYVSAAHAVGVQALPAHHADPFDRLLVAQAMHEPLRLLTADPLLVPYSELVVRL
jgi:PIN domain nuclease of toxin-antitoxin system